MPDAMRELLQWLASAPPGTLIHAHHMHDKLARIYPEPDPTITPAPQARL